MQKGRVVILSGPSGSGKTTLYRKILLSSRLKGKLVKSISVTTRPKRTGEKEGKDYFFISEKRFLYKRRAGHFLESMKVHDYYYGTPKRYVKDLLKKGKHVLLCIDVKGARVVSAQYPRAVKIFVKTASFEVLKKRLLLRGTENPKTLKARLKAAREELKEAKRYDKVIINDSFQRANKEIENYLCMRLFS